MSENSSSLDDKDDPKEQEASKYSLYDSPNRAGIGPVQDEEPMLSFDPDVRIELNLALQAPTMTNRSSSSSMSPQLEVVDDPPEDSSLEDHNDWPMFSNGDWSRNTPRRSRFAQLPPLDYPIDENLVEEVRAPMGTHRFRVYRHSASPAAPRREQRRMDRSARHNRPPRIRSRHSKQVNANLLTIGRRATLMVGSGRHDRPSRHSISRTPQARTSYSQSRSNVFYAPRLELHRRLHARSYIPSLVPRPDPITESYARYRRPFGRSVISRGVYSSSWPFSRHPRTSTMALPRLPGLDDDIDSSEDSSYSNRLPSPTRDIPPAIRSPRVRPVSPVIDLQHFRAQAPPNPERLEDPDNLASYSPPPPLAAYRQYNRDG